MDLHEIFARNLADDKTFMFGMSVTGVAFIVLGLIMVLYGYKHRHGTEIQASHMCFGYILILFGIILGILAGVSEDHVCAALLGFFLFMVAVTVLVQKIKKIKMVKEKIEKIEDFIDKKIS